MDGMDIIDLGRYVGECAYARPFEIAAVLNRLRTLQVVTAKKQNL